MAEYEDEELLRTRDGRHASVGYVELFFDLVFVFAVTQLSHTLIEQPSLQGLMQTAVMTGAVWWIWINTAWATNWLDVERTPVRVMLFVMMGLGLLMSVSIPGAFEARGLVFALGLAGFQLVRTAFVIWAVRNDDPLRRNFQRILGWHAGSAALWIAGGAIGGEWQLAIWAAALLVDSLGPAASFWLPGLGRSTTSDWNVEGGHIAERCALFTIIALGESVLVIGATMADLDWTPAVFAAFAASLGGAAAMWWIYFSTNAEAAAEVISDSDDPGRMARLAYTYIHLLPVAGIIVTAVGDEWVLAHPHGDAELKTVLAAVGGPALYLAGVALFKLAVFRKASPAWLAGLGLLGGLALCSGWLAPVWLAVGSTTILVLVGVWEAIALARGARVA
ncbi:MAG TPA: low temperature requirement protein A [Caulobacter sp.]|nr:low temperature requirement protein A [Caulobacter sp.]